MNGTDGLVLHHLCWADDLYAMAGSIEHLIRILTDMTNAVEDLNMRWKEKSLKIVAGPYTDYKPGQTVEIVSKGGRKYTWHVTKGMGSAWHMVGQQRLLCNKYVAQDFEGQLFVLREKGPHL